MIRRARIRSAAAVLASAALLAPVGPLATSAAAQSSRARADEVSITVDDVSRTTANTSAAQAPLTVTLTVTNRSGAAIDGMRIEGERGEPISTQSALTSALAKVAAPTGHVVPITPTTPVKLSLLSGESRQVVFRTTTSSSTPTGLCACHDNAIYPLYFSAHVPSPADVDQQLGIAATYVSSFLQTPAPVRVSWVWPLIDQPHRLATADPATGQPLFTDDALAGSVGGGGRLDRALSVVEAVGGKIPLTLVVDPELLDELQVMATKPYRVVSSKTRTVPGLGATAAASWLGRLRAVLAADPTVRLELTPYADPDVEALSHEGLNWSADLPSDLRADVTAALGTAPPPRTLAWPAGGALSRHTLDTLAGQGVSTLLLNGAAVGPRPAPGAIRPGLARISAGGEDLGAGLLDPTLQRYAQQALTVGDAGPAALPPLFAELAVRAAQEPTAEHVAVLAAPRWVDPDVDSAVRAIEQTSSSLVTKPVGLADAISGALLPNGRSRLARAPSSARTLPAANLAVTGRVARELPAFRSLLTPARPQRIDPQAAALLRALPEEAQRAASSAWGRPGNAAAGARFAGRITTQLDGLTHGVVIITPSSGSYTLASDNSPLPITVENNLAYPVTVTVNVGAEGGLPGFSARPQTESVEAHSKRTLQVQTKIARPGRIRVQAALLAPDGTQLGSPVTMTVRSTALGVVGVVITIVAGAVLVLALLVRFARRLRHRRRGTHRRPRWDPDAPDAAQEFAATAAPAESSR